MPSSTLCKLLRHSLFGAFRIPHQCKLLPMLMMMWAFDKCPPFGAFRIPHQCKLLPMRMMMRTFDKCSPFAGTAIAGSTERGPVRGPGLQFGTPAAAAAR